MSSDLLISLPLTLLLPTIGHNTEYKSRWRESRQVKVDNSMEEEEEEEVLDKENISVRQPLHSRLHTFFWHLGGARAGV